jgi:hypothetical protein
MPDADPEYHDCKTGDWFDPVTADWLVDEVADCAESGGFALGHTFDRAAAGKAVALHDAAVRDHQTEQVVLMLRDQMSKMRRDGDGAQALHCEFCAALVDNWSDGFRRMRECEPEGERS